MSSSNIVKLDIGGTVFKTTKSTLTKYEGFFKTLLETDLTIEKDESGCIFVDRSPKHFDLILNYMRDGEVALPTSEQDIHEILKEAQYYLLEGLIELCGGKPPAPAKAEVSKGVRIVESSEEMEQLRDKTKSLILICYPDEGPYLRKISERFLEPWSSVERFVQKHESRFDIFFEPVESRSRFYTVNFVETGKVIIGAETFKNVEALFTSVEKCIEKHSSN